MAKRRRRQKENGNSNFAQSLGIFLFFLLVRMLLLIFSENLASKYLDIMGVFVAFMALRTNTKGIPLLLWAWLGGLTEDLFNGAILGVNALSKITIAEGLNILERKIEVGNTIVQMFLAIAVFAADVLMKYAIATAFLEETVSGNLLLSTITIKVASNTLLFLISCAIMR